MSDRSVANPFSTKENLGNLYQLMLDTFGLYDWSGDQKLHIKKELKLDNYDSSLLDNHTMDSRVTKFELRKAFQSWSTIKRFLSSAPEIDAVWDVRSQAGKSILIKNGKPGFDIMKDASSMLASLPESVASKTAQRLYDFAHDFRYYCSISKKKHLLIKYHNLIRLMSSPDWMGTRNYTALNRGLEALKVIQDWLRDTKDPESFLERVEIIASSRGAKAILMTEKMIKVRQKLEDEPVEEDKKVLAIMNVRTGDVRYMTISKSKESQLALPMGEIKIGATMITGKGGETRKVAYMTNGAVSVCPWFIKLGKLHMQKKFAEAKRKLDMLDIRSERYPDRLITQVIDPKMLETFLIIEHVGGKPILDAAAAKDWQKVSEFVDRTHFHIGFEGDAAYKDSLSYVGARGIAQFMKSTYARLTRKHAHLESDYVKGTTDHVNAIMAQYHLADDWLIYARRKLNGLKSATERAGIQTRLSDSMTLRKYIAGSYNGGTVGFRWVAAGMKDAPFLPAYEETMTYIKKFNIVYNHGAKDDKLDMVVKK